MPLYEYECFVCAHRFERIQRVSDEQVKLCPSCGGAVRRLLGAPALQFKGSGWYVTDYGKGSNGVAKAETPPSGDTPSSSSSDASSSSKPAGSTDTPSSSPTKDAPSTTAKTS